MHQLCFGVRNGSHIARSRSVSATSERIEQAGEATLAQGTARCASRRQIHFIVKDIPNN